jgi:hypothetical protein
VLCAWVAVVVARSLRDRPSPVKSASGVANAMPLRATPDLRASTTPHGQHYGQAGACPPPPQPPTHSTTTPKKQQKQQHPKTKTPDPLDTAPPLQGLTCEERHRRLRAAPRQLLTRPLPYHTPLIHIHGNRA